MKTTKKGMGYMPQLDALRAFAVIFVLFHHWLPEKHLINYLPTGPMGVTLFFVLSGFLISGILFQNKDAIKHGLQTPREVIKTFYIRRSLRIFPIYFIVIFFCWMFQVENIQNHIIWFITYTSNILHFTTEQWMGSLSHLWTLAVEEQYYMIVPLIIIFVAEKHMLKTIWIIILIGPLSRLLIYFLMPESNHPEILMSVLTFSAFDCFGLGTLLAYIRLRKDKKTNDRFDFFLWNFFILSLIGFAFLVALYNDVYTSLWLRTLFSIISLYLVSLAAKGIKGRFAFLLNNAIVMYLGKISYGIYLFHMFMPFIWQEILRKYPNSIMADYLTLENPYLLFGVYFLSTLAVSTFSWIVVEKPMNDLKKLAEYGKSLTINMSKNEVFRLSFMVLFFVAIGILGSTNSNATNSKYSARKEKVLPTKTTGFFAPAFNKAISDSTINLSNEVPFAFDVFSLYLAWGEGQSFDIPVKLIQRMEKKGKRAFITWEPWTVTFPSMKIDNKEVHKAICDGGFDNYLQKQTTALNQLEGPIYIRWGHNIDRMDVPWSAITQGEIDHYKKAHSYLHNFFRERLGDKIKWVWPAPHPNRLMDYLPENLDMDFIGVGAINYGKDKEDKDWRDFDVLYEKYEQQLKMNDLLEKAPIFLTEIGMEHTSKDEKEWFVNATQSIRGKKEISHAVFFLFHERSLQPEWFTTSLH